MNKLIEKNQTSYKIGKKIYHLPIELKKIVEKLQESKKILDLKDDWDGENSIAYLEETWTNATTFLFNYAKEIYKDINKVIDLPNIYPGPDGSIDIDWETETYGILINILPAGASATFYADDKNKQTVKGKFNPQNFNINLLPKALSTT